MCICRLSSTRLVACVSGLFVLDCGGAFGRVRSHRCRAHTERICVPMCWFVNRPRTAWKNCICRRYFTSSVRDIGSSFQLAITAPQINFIGYGTATAQSQTQPCTPSTSYGKSLDKKQTHSSAHAPLYTTPHHLHDKQHRCKHTRITRIATQHT